MCPRLCRPKYLHGDGYYAQPTTTCQCSHLFVSDLETVHISRKKMRHQTLPRNVLITTQVVWESGWHVASAPRREDHLWSPETYKSDSRTLLTSARLLLVVGHET